MSRLDDYRAALLATFEQVSDEELRRELDARDDAFVSFVVDHGLGPLWRERTGSEALHESRMAAEVLFAVHERALQNVTRALDTIDHVVIKGAANRLLFYAQPSLRACHDIDLLVRREDRIGAAKALQDVGFMPAPEARNISRVVVLEGKHVDIDLHWSLLREGRLRRDATSEFLERRRQVDGVWMLSPEDTLFTLLVHPAFAKHLDGYEMGLHRVWDVLAFLRSQGFDWRRVREMLREAGVANAAWATLRWVEMLAGENAPDVLMHILPDLEPGPRRRKWIEKWLADDWSSRTASWRPLRLLGFSAFLHDTPGDALRALRGRRAAKRRSGADLAEIRKLLDE